MERGEEFEEEEAVSGLFRRKSVADGSTVLNNKNTWSTTTMTGFEPRELHGIVISTLPIVQEWITMGTVDRREARRLLRTSVLAIKFFRVIKPLQTFSVMYDEKFAVAEDDGEDGVGIEVKYLEMKEVRNLPKKASNISDFLSGRQLRRFLLFLFKGFRCFVSDG